MRLFVAINLPEAVRRLIYDGTARLRETEMPARWVAPERIHLTLKFLGDVRDERREDAVAALREAASGYAPFDLALEGVGAFPSLRRPRVVWLGIAATLPLRALKHDVEHAYAQLGFERESRAFHPHLTLGRARDRAEAGEFRALERLAGQIRVQGGFRVEGVELMRSRLGRGGAEYSVEASAGFAGEAP
ncbi:MAG TPA: RNA 2',3'-cyclic phosphodiesterase [Gemmatimonadota bacterium]|nr:RNA 2',3'-cyclic phosphodiesterase [Gemmatimonadota bacterium]